MFKRETYSGMLLILKKRMKCATKKDECHFKIFGHYDGLDIHLVEQWYQMRPQGVKERSGNISLDDDYRDKYILKVYFPEEEEIEKLCNSETDLQKRMDYDTWRIISRSASESDSVAREEYQRLCSEYPFLSLVFLNVSKSMAKKMDSSVNSIGKYVMDAADHAGVALGEVHGAIFPSFGFCDYVLLFLSRNPEAVMAILDCLKEVKAGKLPAISSFYPITGFEPVGLANLEKIDNVRISIRINLREGVSNRQFQKRLREILPEKLRKSRIYHLFGSSDCLFMPDVSFADCIPLYFDSKIFNPESSFYQKHICNLRSSIRIASKDSETAESGFLPEDNSASENLQREKKERIERYTAEFKELRDKLEQAAQKYRMPIRVVYGIQNVMKSFLDLIRSSHCFDLEVVIGRMFAALFRNVDFNLEVIEMLDGKWQRDSIEDLWKALTLFRDFVGTYLSDMQRSDRSFIEGHTLVHQSIGSSTKLLLFYNRFVSEMAEKLVKGETDGKNQTYTFLVTSGGTDVTEAHDLFSHLDPTAEESEDIIVLTIPEMSLYDIRGTLFRLLHECLHFCGERKREERYHQVIEAVSAYSAMIFCRLETTYLSDFFDKLVFNNLKHMFSEEVLELVKNKWEDEIKQEIAGEEKHLKEFLQKIFVNNMEMTSADYYGRYMYGFIEDVAAQEVFAPSVPEADKISGESLFYTLYESFQRLRMNLSSRLIEILRQEPAEVLFSNAQFIENIARENMEMQKQGKYVTEDQWFVDKLIESYTGKRIEERYFELSETDMIDFSELLQCVNRLFKECYADCIAATILGADFTDIIMGITYETWDIERAFPATSFERMRRMIEKDLLNADCNIVKKEMQDRVLCWSLNGYESPACQNNEDREQLFKRVLGVNDEDDKAAYDCLIRPVEKYLGDCIDIMKKDLTRFENERKIFQYAAFQNENDLQLFLKEMNGSWKKYAEEDKNADA